MHSLMPLPGKNLPYVIITPQAVKNYLLPQAGISENLSPCKMGGGIYVSQKLKNSVLYFGIFHQKKAPNNYERCFLFYQKPDAET